MEKIEVVKEAGDEYHPAEYDIMNTYEIDLKDVPKDYLRLESTKNTGFMSANTICYV